MCVFSLKKGISQLTASLILERHTFHQQEGWSGSETRGLGICQMGEEPEKQTALCSLQCQQPCHLACEDTGDSIKDISPLDTTDM